MPDHECRECGVGFEGFTEPGYEKEDGTFFEIHDGEFVTGAVTDGGRTLCASCFAHLAIEILRAR